MAASGLSLWELGDLLGIHPHLLTAPALVGQPAWVLVVLARALQMHPADLYPDLDSVLGNRREIPAHCQDAQNRPGGDRGTEDVLRLLTALAYSRTPLGPSDLATALEWPLGRVTAALQAAGGNPDLGGPLTLRRIPAEIYMVAPRPDTLTSRQRHAITSIARCRDMLTDEQATVLLAALAFGRAPRYARFREGRQHTEHTLKETGLLRIYHGPHHTEVGKDVRFSLRYSDDKHITAGH